MSIFFVRNLYVSGNGDNFSMPLKSNIWDYVICSCAKVSRVACDVLWALVTYQKWSQIVTDPYELQDFNFYIDSCKEWYFTDLLKLSFQIYMWVAKTLHLGLLLPCWCLSLHVVTVWNACWKSLVWNTCTMLHSKAGCCLTTCSRHNEVNHCT